MNSKKGKGWLWFFFLYPFAAFVRGIFNFHQKESRIVVYLFFLLYGFTFVVVSQSVDAFRHAETFRQTAEINFSEFIFAVKNIYSNDPGGKIDLILPALIFLLSRLTDEPAFLFLGFAAVYGFFYLKGISLVYDRMQENKNINALVHFILLISISPIFKIGGFRFGLATWVFFVGVYQVLVLHKKKYLILILFAPLAHFSFIGASFIFLIYFILKNQNWIYYSCLAGSFIAPNVLVDYGSQIGGLFGSAIQKKVESYANVARMEATDQLMESASWFVVWHQKLVLWYLVIAVIALRIRFSAVCRERELRNIYSFLLLFFAYVNLGINIPSFGFRFVNVFTLFPALFIILVFAKIYQRGLHWITLIGLFPIFLRVAVVARESFASINPWLFAPMPLPLIGESIPIFHIYEYFFK